MNLFYRYSQVFLIYILALLIITCAKKSLENPDDVIVVSISDSIVICKNEIIERAEYTRRLSRGGIISSLDNVSILNLLIAEKLLALEAGKDDEMIGRADFKSFVEDRKEQVMRQWMYRKFATEKVKITSSDVDKYYKYSGRVYNVMYYNVKDTTLLNEYRKSFNNSNNYFEGYFRHVYGISDIPVRSVAWTSNEHFSILKSFFTTNIKNGDVLQPIKILGRDPVLFKIQDWTDTKIYTESQIKERRAKVKERLEHEMAKTIWSNYVNQLMLRNRIEINRSVVDKLSDIFSYSPSDRLASSQASVPQWPWNDSDRENNDIFEKIEALFQENLVIIDGHAWTVEDMNGELLSLPLISTKQIRSAENYSQSFHSAIDSLIQDIAVTQEAYQLECDKENSVMSKIDSWQDACLAQYQKELYLTKMNENNEIQKNSMIENETQLNRYVNKLYSSHIDQIEFNSDAYKSIDWKFEDSDVIYKSPYDKKTIPKIPVFSTKFSKEFLNDIAD